MVINRISSEVKDGLWHKGVEFATYQAQKLLQESGITRPPFLPERLAALRGIKILKEDLGNLDSLLLPLRDGFEIKINATHSPERQNYSCAHEIGHTFFFEEEGKALIRLLTKEGEKTRNNWLENLCDISAAELLMPSVMFSKYASDYKFHISSLATLSRIFNTSVDAIAIRLCDFIAKPCFVTHSVIDNSQELGNLRFRTTWLTWSRMRMPSKASRLLFNPKLLGEKSGMLKAFRSDNATYSREWMGIVNFRGYCRIWSQGFTSGSNRFVISLIFPECDN
jgi:Zn-dependent peptidase ImmA (M78 family)